MSVPTSLLRVITSPTTSSFAKAEASFQLGETVAADSTIVGTVIPTLHTALLHDDWEQRAAAGAALHAVTSRSGHALLTVDGTQASFQAGVLRFRGFDLATVVGSGEPLLAHGNPLYDFDADDGLSPEDRVTLQRHSVLCRLGLEASSAEARTAAVYQDDDYVADEDLVVDPTMIAAHKRAAQLERYKRKPVAELVQTARATPELSARERNQAARRVADGDGGSAAGAPARASFARVFDELLYELFEPKWTRRHGAAVGLREVLRARPVGLERPAPGDDDFGPVFLQDTAVRCLCVLALDRFGDFAADSVVAPVRYVVAQVLALVVRMLPRPGAEWVVQRLLELCAHRTVWHTRHGAVLGIKFAFALPSGDMALPPECREAMWNVSCVLLSDVADDVCACAADVLEAVLTLAPPDAWRPAPDAMGGALELVWRRVAPRKVPLATFAASALPLVATLLGRCEGAAALTDAKVATVMHYLRSPLRGVRSAALRCVVFVGGSLQLVTTLATATGGVMRCLAVEPEDDLVGLCAEAMAALVSAAHHPPKAVHRATSAAVTDWCAALAMPGGDVLTLPDGFTPLPDTPPLGFARRLRACRVVGSVVSAWPPAAQTVWLESQVPALLDPSRVSAVQCGGMLLSAVKFHAEAAPALEAARQAAAAILREFQSGALPPPQEAAVAIGHVAAAVVDVMGAFRAAGVEVEPPVAGVELDPLPPPAWLLSNATAVSHMAEVVTASAGPQWLTQLDTLPDGHKGHAHRPNCAAHLHKLGSVTEVVPGTIQALFVRGAALAAAASVGVMAAMPAKVGAVVRGLMDAIKTDADPDAQAFAAEVLSRFTSLEATGANPTAKIMRNVCAFVQAGAVDANTTRWRGACLAVRAFVASRGESAFEALPHLWEVLTAGTTSAVLDHLNGGGGGLESTVVTDGHLAAALGTVRLLDAVATGLAPSALTSRLMPSVVPAVLKLACAPLGPLREEAAKAIGAVAACSPQVVVPAVASHVVSVLGLDALAAHAGLGALHLVGVVAGFEASVLPFASALVAAVLPHMSSSEGGVREAAASVFAKLVPVVPLDALHASTPEVTDPHLVAMREKGHAVLAGLLAGPAALDTSAAIRGVRPTVALRPYQQEGVAWLRFLRQHALHGVLADDMGLGKTLQALLAVGADAVDRLSSEGPPLLPTLVVCPASVTHHWMVETRAMVTAEGCTGALLTPYLFMGPSRGEALRAARASPTPAVVVTSYAVLRCNVKALSASRWAYVVLDEGHLVRNPASKLAAAVKSLVADSRLILTGTPIQNHVLDLWSLFDFLMPGYLGARKAFNKSVAHVIERSRRRGSSTAQCAAAASALRCLHRQVLPFVLRRLKSVVLVDLPPKVIQDVPCPLTPAQAEVYEAFVETAGYAALEAVGVEDGVGAGKRRKGGKKAGGRGATHVFSAVHYLRQVCNHPVLVGKGAAVLSASCKLLALKALLVQAGLQDGEAVAGVVGGAGAGAAAEPTPAELEEAAGGGGKDAPHKGDPAVDVLNVHPSRGTPPLVASSHKVLVFAQLSRMLDLVASVVLEPHFPKLRYARIDGSVPVATRGQTADAFNRDPNLRVLLLTTAVGGLGLNLASADVVILVDHDWNPMRDLQAMDRAHRLGQRRTVHVYRLIATDTLEERIMGLQRFKQHVAGAVVSADNASLGVMSDAEMLALLKASEEGGEAGAVAKKRGRGSMPALDELWSELEYADQDLGAFLDSLPATA